MLIDEMINKKSKKFAALLDPDKAKAGILLDHGLPDLFFIGGSFVSNRKMDALCQTLKNETKIPLILFPADPSHISMFADAILFLSLVSGRNPEFLIGKHVVSAPILKRSKLEILPTGYMLVDGGVPTSASYISNTFPLPYDKVDVAVATAIAAEMLGMRYIYLDTGSGAQKTVSLEMVRAVSSEVSLPVIVGGGIKTPQNMEEILNAGANVVVIGNLLEKKPELISEFKRVTT